MNLYITFYTTVGNRLYINNGFSFGVEKEKDDKFIFLSTFSSEKKVYEEIHKYRPEKIFCSFCFYKQLSLIKPFLNSKWILGGPLIRRPYFSELVGETDAVVFSGLMEHFLNKEISGDFSPYFEEFIRENFLSDFTIFYSVSVGIGCYWKKCNFCSYKSFEESSERIIERPNIETILDNLPVFKKDSFFEPPNVIAHTCISSATPKILNKILSTKKTVNFFTYIRADKKIIDIIKNYDDLSNQNLSIGLEGFNQHTLDELKKGFKIENVLKLTDLITERKGCVFLNIMEDYPFLTKDDVLESFAIIDRIKEINNKNDLVVINSNGSVWWPKIEFVSKWGVPFKRSFGEWVACLLSPDSEQYKYNKQIMDYLKESKISFMKGVWI